MKKAEIWTNANLPALIETGKISGLMDEWFLEDGSFNIAEYAQPIDPSVFFDKDGRFTPAGVASDNYGGPNTYTVVVTNNVL